MPDENEYYQNARKPEGDPGKMMLQGMNERHAGMAEWGFSHLRLKDGLHILDVGCGGGANIAKMLKDFPNSIVDGIDYSETSVALSKETNEALLGKRCAIQQGDVAALPYEDNFLDAVTAFETIYFWPSLQDAFREIKRVLKAGGLFFICCETDDAGDTTWTDIIEGMTVYSGDDLKNRLLQAGFQTAEVYRHENGWACVRAVS